MFVISILNELNDMLRCNWLKQVMGLYIKTDFSFLDS